MPSWDKISHVSFSARDKDECAKWLERVLGFKPVDTTEGPDWQAVLLIHPPSATIFEFQQHAANAGEPFDPRRTGLDHVGLKVGTRAELDEWQQHFARLGIEYTPVVEREYGAVLTFRDPDGRQFEMFFRDDHP